MKLMKLCLLLHIILFMSCSSNAKNIADAADSDIFPVFNEQDYQLAHKFYGKDRSPLGSVYVKYISDNVFTSMVIKEKDDILYFIDTVQFIGEDGVETKVFAKGFYGYRIVLAKDDYIVINYLRNEGKDVSDDITIEWDYDNKAFHILKTP